MKTYLNNTIILFDMVKHIAIILDGNRRFGRKKGKKQWEGHLEGAKKVEELINWCIELGIKEVTLYSFSTENFKRPEKEVNFLFDQFRKHITKLMNDKRIEKEGICVRFIGRLSLFPDDLQEHMNELMEKTKENNKFKINFAMAYGARAEIVDAVNKILSKGLENVDEGVFSEYLYLKDSPDLLIRPGGEKRLSNFLLWQLSYSELYFTEKLWPEFTKEDLVEAIEEFGERERRFGL